MKNGVYTRVTKEVFDQEYYNLDSYQKNVTKKLSTKEYPVGEGTVIAILISKDDLDQVKVALQSLTFLQGDTNPKHPAPVLIFNEGNLTDATKEEISLCTDRPIGFPVVDFSSPVEYSNSDHEEHEKSWDYKFMRFWVTSIWKQPVIQRFDSVMRIDSDSCFKEVNDFLPNFSNDYLYYHSPFVGLTKNSNIEGLFDFVKSWMKHNKDSKNPENELLFHYAEASWKSKKTLPAFLTTFELSRISFMQQRDVVGFQNAVTEKEPHPMLKYLWEDSVLRFLTLSVFASSDRLSTEPIKGYVHKDRQGCTRVEVEKALLAHNLFDNDEASEK